MRMRLARYGHAPAALLCAALLATAVLTGCVFNRLSPDAASGVRLQGVWRLNRAASQDPQKIIAALREEAEKKIRKAMNAAPPPTMVDPSGGGGGGRRRRGGGSGSGSAEQDDVVPPQGPPPGADPLRNSPTMHALRDVLQRGEYLTVKQSSDQVSFDYGNFKRSYTPGGHSVVSSETGVADQTSGWDGKAYVIKIRPQLGPAIVEEYGLSPDGKQLIVKTQIGPFELRKVELTRVYDVTSAVVPNSGPSIE
jgi:hypothetical protein